MTQIETALKYMTERLQFLELGKEFSYYQYIRDANGDIQTNSLGQEKVTKYTVKGYIEKISTYYENIAAMIEELSASRSAIGVSYLGGKTELHGYAPTQHPSHMRDGTGNAKRQTYIHHAKYIITVFVNTEGTQSSMLEGWNGLSIFDTLEHVKILLDGQIPVYASSPLKWTSNQKAVQLNDSDKRYGPVLYGITFEHDIIVNPDVHEQSVITLDPGQPNITFEVEGITYVNGGCTAQDGSEINTGVY